jgi:shikimate kinase
MSVNGTRFFIIGFMGVGKSTVGRDLATRLGVPFYDLDEEIEQDTGKKIQEIFETVGESAFRAIEAELLRKIVKRDPGIIATGGGTFSRPENRELIRSSGVSVWLDAPTDLVIERGAREDHRPLWRRPEQVRALLDERLPQYRQADIRFEMKSWSPEEVTARLADLLESYCESL